MKTCRLKRIVVKPELHGEVASHDCRLLKSDENTRPLTYHIVVGVSTASAAKVQSTSTVRSRGLTLARRYHG